MYQNFFEFNTTDELGQGTDIDCGQKTLRFIFENMMIDKKWSVQANRAFVWWGHQLAQRIWAEPLREYHNEQISQVHVETNFLCKVQNTEKTYELLNTIQSTSSLYAFIYYPTEREIKLHSTAYVYDGNYEWLSRLLLGVAGFQLSDAHRYTRFQQIFEGSAWDTTPHPINRYRETPDEIIDDIGKVCEAAGEHPVKVPDIELKEIRKVLSELSVLALSDETGLTAEFHFVGDEPAMQRLMDSKKGVATSLFQTEIDITHPQLGHGIYSNLRLPLADTQERGYRRCNQLNLLECSQWTNFHLLGAWQAAPDANNMVTVNFSSFLPAISYRPGILANLTVSNGVRSKWASTTGDTMLYEAEKHLYKENIYHAEKQREEKKPEESEDYYKRGNTYYEKGEHDKAMSDYTKAIELDPGYFGSHLIRGVSYYEKGEYDKAISDYTKAIELGPNNALVYYSRGTAYMHKGEYDKAITDFTKAIALEPNNSLYYNCRGAAYIDQAEFDKAISDCTKAIEIDPNNADAFNNRKLAYERKGENDKATDDLRQVLILRLEDASTYFKRGNNYADKGDYDKAITDFTKAIEIWPQFAEAYYNRGITYGDKGEHDKAITDYTKAIELNPKHTLAYDNRGLAHGHKGEYDKAITDFTKAIEIDPNKADAYHNRAVSYHKKGDKDKAFDDYTKAKEMGYK